MINRTFSRSEFGLSDVGIALFYLGVTMLVVFPLIRHLDSALPGPPADNFQVLYQFWWLKRSIIVQHISPFYDPNSFYPFGYDLRLSDMMLLVVSQSLPFTLFWNEVVAYNFLAMSAFVFSGWAMHRYVWELTKNRWAGLVAGAVFAFAPFRWNYLFSGHINLLQTGWLPLMLIGVERFLTGRGARWAGLAGLFWAFLALCNWYSALIGGLGLAVYVLVRWVDRPQVRSEPRSVSSVASNGAPLGSAPNYEQTPTPPRYWLWGSLAFLGVGVVVTGPLVLWVAQAFAQARSSYSLPYLVQPGLAASLDTLISPRPLAPLWGGQPIKSTLEGSIYTYLGLIAVCVALIGWWRRSKVNQNFRTTLRAVTAVGLMGLVLSLGIVLTWGAEIIRLPVPEVISTRFDALMGLVINKLAFFPTPSYYGLHKPGTIYLPLPALLLYCFVPFFQSIRFWRRFEVWIVFAIAAWVGAAIASWPQTLSEQQSLRRLLYPLATPALLILILLEFTVFPYPLGISKVAPQPVDVWLAAQPRCAVARFPIEATWQNGPYQYALTMHHQPILYGIGAFRPAWFTAVQPVLAAFPSPESLALLRSWKVCYLVVTPQQYGERWEAIRQALQMASGVTFRARLEGETIYDDWRPLGQLTGYQLTVPPETVWVYELETNGE